MNASEIKAPHRPYEEIRLIAEDFLGRYNPEDHLPVPIEKITEFQLGIDIRPIPEIEIILGAVSWITKDFTEICIDKNVFENYEYRYCFSIAHEIGHMFLHKDIFDEISFSNTIDWKKNMIQIPVNEYGWIEQHAYNFAGLVLVPEHNLRDEYIKAVNKIQGFGFDKGKNLEMFNEYVSSNLQRVFNVSAGTIARRIRYDKLDKTFEIPQ